jgi:hypothetical protein
MLLMNQGFLIMLLLSGTSAEHQRSPQEHAYAEHIVVNYKGSRHLGPHGPRDANAWDYGTHTTPLLNAVLSTTGDVLELGCGDFSTPMLDTVLSRMPGRHLYTAEGDASWLEQFRNLASPWHTLKNVPAFQMQMSSKLPLPKWMKREWGLVFIDQAPGDRRRRDMKRLRKMTQVFVVHDTSSFVEHIYHLESVLSSFKYRYTYPRYLRTTDIVSDHVDVRKWFDIGNSNVDDRKPVLLHSEELPNGTEL